MFTYLGEFLPKTRKDVVLGKLEIFWNIGMILLPGKNICIRVFYLDLVLTSSDIEIINTLNKIVPTKKVSSINSYNFRVLQWASTLSRFSERKL